MEPEYIASSCQKFWIVILDQMAGRIWHMPQRPAHNDRDVGWFMARVPRICGCDSVVSPAACEPQKDHKFVGGRGNHDWIVLIQISKSQEVVFVDWKLEPVPRLTSTHAH